MRERHFAFFRHDTGEYVREWKGSVPEPAIDLRLTGDAREQALIAWATEVSGGRPGEIGLDVTPFGYPVGDFCWMHFDVIDRCLDWPVAHKFIQIDRATLQIDVNHASPRPVRSTPERLVIDITGTSLEPYHGHIFGRVVRREDGWALEPLRDPAIVPVPTQRALEAARIGFDLVTEPVRVLAHV